MHFFCHFDPFALDSLLLVYSKALYFLAIFRKYIAETIDNSSTRSHNSVEHFLPFTLKGRDYRQTGLDQIPQVFDSTFPGQFHSCFYQLEF